MTRCTARLGGATPVVLGLIVAGPFCFKPVDETDIGWHLALGRLIAQGDFPRRNALSWTQPSYPWYPTSWLFDWVCYHVDSTLGALGLQLLVFALLAVTLVFATSACRCVNPRYGAWLIPILALLLVPRLTIRPHLVSWALLAAIVSLGAAARGRSWRVRAISIPLIALGSNLHAGAIFSAAALATFCAEAALLEGGVGREVFIAAAGFLALVANPGGSSNILYAVFHLRVHELINLSEFETPGLLDLPAFYLLIPITLALALVRIRRRPAGILLVLGFALGGIWAARLAFKFYVVAMETLADALPIFRERYGRHPSALLWTLLILVATASNVRRFSNLRLSPTWDKAVLPIRAANFIQTHHLDGRFYNAFADGGYLEYALPKLPAFQDARVNAYAPEFFARQLRIDAPEGFDLYLRGLGVEWALTRNENAPLNGNFLLPPAGWALVYWDDFNELFVRRDVPRFGRLIQENEFRYFNSERTTPRSILEVVGKLGQTELLEYTNEVARFQQSTPDDRFAALARCALANRLSAGDAKMWCEKATKLAKTKELQELIQLAQHLASP